MGTDLQSLFSSPSSNPCSLALRQTISPMTSSRMIFACGVVLLASCIYGIPVENADLTDKIVQKEATTRSEDPIVEIFTHSHEDEALFTPEQQERASAEVQELQTEQEARATDGGCGWTRDYSCPGQQLGRKGRANADGSAGYRNCCLHGKWKLESKGYSVAEYNRAVGSKGCAAPLHFTSCVHSSWHNMKNERHKFQAQCKGVLIGFGNRDKAQDCGQACWGCSFIRACCDTCDTIFTIEPQYINLGHTSVAQKLTQEYGVSSSSAGGWSQTETWSQSVTAGFSTTVKGVDIEASATLGHEFSASQSYSWKQSASSKTAKEYTQPAHTTAWGFQWKITDSCGVKYARTKDLVMTSGPTPKCLPGNFATKDGSMTAPTKCRPGYKIA